MTPQERLALALQYQKQRDLGSALPFTPAENAARPVQEPKQSWLDKLSEAASGVGYGLGQQVEGLGQMARHPLDTLHSLAVGAGKAMDNPSAAAQAAWEGLKQSAGEAVSSPFNLGQTVGANVNINPRKLAAMLESPAVREITAYHGTPHRFPATEANPLGEFDASKIGTGEGAQAYGHGVYLAESPEVAKGYQSTLREKNAWEIDGQRVHGVRSRLDAQPINYAANALERFDGDKKAAIAWLKDSESPMDLEAARLLAKSKTAQKAPGSLYHADLPDEMIDRMLDWDKPLSEQPAALSAIKNMSESKFLEEQGKNIENLTGQEFHRLIADSSAHGHKDSYRYTANRFKAAGIPGIKYLDAGSRGAEGTGTRNFVVFPGEEKKVKILERK